MVKASEKVVMIKEVARFCDLLLRTNVEKTAATKKESLSGSSLLRLNKQLKDGTTEFNLLLKELREEIMHTTGQERMANCERVDNAYLNYVDFSTTYLEKIEKSLKELLIKNKNKYSACNNIYTRIIKVKALILALETSKAKCKMASSETMKELIAEGENLYKENKGILLENPAIWGSKLDGNLFVTTTKAQQQ